MGSSGSSRAASPRAARSSGISSACVTFAASPGYPNKPLECHGETAVIVGARMPGARMRRVNESIREVLGDAIAAELKDPRIGFVTVTEVDTSPDLRSARVYVSVLGDER